LPANANNKTIIINPYTNRIFGKNKIIVMTKIYDVQIQNVIEFCFNRNDNLPTKSRPIREDVAEER